ncbi:MAG: DUF2490 domain-containing protein [Gemmatimonadaceae bacterium]|nr:DUF2490 domain-containing protein [Gemmatimonadaceae bacterium]
MPRHADRLRRSVISATLLVGAARGASAQAPPRVTNEAVHNWYALFGDHRLSERWAFTYDIQNRRADIPGASWQQLLVRPALTRAFGHGLRGTAGYAFVETHPYGEDAAPARFPEHRLWQQLALTQHVRAITLAHRARLEQRWIGVVPRPDIDPVRWQYANRARYLLRATTPRLGALGGSYLTAYDEAFWSLGDAGAARRWEQNRAYVGLGVTFSPTWRAEAAYMEQRIWRAGGARLERNHTLMLTLFSSTPIRR